MSVTWHERDGAWLCEQSACIRGEVRYAHEGEAEGGLGILVRHMSAALQPSVALPALSPAGYYWTAMRERGVWSSWQRAEHLAQAKTQVETVLAQMHT